MYILIFKILTKSLAYDIVILNNQQLVANLFIEPDALCLF